MGYDPEYYAANREKFAAWKRRYRKENREKVALANKVYKQKNKEKYAATERRRRARVRNAASEVYTIADVLSKYGASCHICGKEINLKAERKSGRKGWEDGLHIDHLVEIFQGGSDTLDNVRPAHGLCNLQRSNKNRQSLTKEK